MKTRRLLLFWALAAVLSLLAGVALLQAESITGGVAAAEAVHIRVGILFALSGAAAAVALTQSLSQQSFEQGDLEDDAVVEPTIESGSEAAADIDAISSGMQALLGDIDNAYRSQQRLIRGLGHDLRSPLASIVSMSDTMRAGHFGELSEQQGEAIRLMGETATRLIGQIEVLYALSEGRDWFDAEHLTHVDVNSLVKRITDGYRPAAASRGIGLTLAVPAVPVVIVTDAKAVERIVANLADNAVKFTDVGRVRLKLSPTPDNGARIEVSDTGVGIPEDELHKITEEYFRASSGAGRPGTGVGLSVTHELCERLGGSLTIDSTAGVGSTFVATLPHTAPSVHPAPSGHPAPDEA